MRSQEEALLKEVADEIMSELHSFKLKIDTYDPETLMSPIGQQAVCGELDGVASRVKHKSALAKILEQRILRKSMEATNG